MILMGELDLESFYEFSYLDDSIITHATILCIAVQQ